MVSASIDKVQNGKCNNFEACATHLLPYDPVKKRRLVLNKRGSDEISDTTLEGSIIGATHGIGKTGVHFRFYRPGE